MTWGNGALLDFDHGYFARLANDGYTVYRLCHGKMISLDTYRTLKQALAFIKTERENAIREKAEGKKRRRK